MPRAIVIVLCLVLSSCQLWRVDGMMDAAERQMGCAADSALTTMRAVRRYAVLTPERRARYGLLYSMALDKNGIDVASDSLIGYSAAYYDREGTPIERMKAYYYLGRTQENPQQCDKAILSYLDAAQYADNVTTNICWRCCTRTSVVYITPPTITKMRMTAQSVPMATIFVQS